MGTPTLRSRIARGASARTMERQPCKKKGRLLGTALVRFCVRTACDLLFAASVLATLNGERTVRTISTTTTVEQRPGGGVSVLVRTPVEG